MARPQKNLRQAAEAAGRRGEIWAALYLRLKGYHILQRRYKTKLGEIDLIAQRGKVIAFVEVKTRKTLEAGLYSVGTAQSRRISRAASLYMAARKDADKFDWRYDIIITGASVLPHHIKDAWRD